MKTKFVDFENMHGKTVWVNPEHVISFQDSDQVCLVRLSFVNNAPPMHVKGTLSEVRQTLES